VRWGIGEGRLVEPFAATGRAVLGIDAAWTATEPSGVALAVEDASGWRLVAVDGSYDHFQARARGMVPFIGRVTILERSVRKNSSGEKERTW